MRATRTCRFLEVRFMNPHSPPPCPSQPLKHLRVYGSRFFSDRVFLVFLQDVFFSAISLQPMENPSAWAVYVFLSIEAKASAGGFGAVRVFDGGLRVRGPAPRGACLRPGPALHHHRREGRVEFARASARSNRFARKGGGLNSAFVQEGVNRFWGGPGNVASVNGFGGMREKASWTSACDVQRVTWTHWF